MGQQEINSEYRTGQERFYDRYPNYPRMEEELLGVGAMMVDPERLRNNGIEGKVRVTKEP